MRAEQKFEVYLSNRRETQRSEFVSVLSPRFHRIVGHKDNIFTLKNAQIEKTESEKGKKGKRERNRERKVP